MPDKPLSERITLALADKIDGELLTDTELLLIKAMDACLIVEAIERLNPCGELILERWPDGTYFVRADDGRYGEDKTLLSALQAAQESNT